MRRQKLIKLNLIIYLWKGNKVNIKVSRKEVIVR